MRYIETNRKLPVRRSIRFPKLLVWELHFVKAIDKSGAFRLGITLVKPDERVMFEIAPIPPTEHLEAFIVTFFRTYLIEETPWYGRPKIVNIRERALRTRLMLENELRDIRFEHRVVSRRYKTSQYHFAKCVNL